MKRETNAQRIHKKACVWVNKRFTSADFISRCQSIMAYKFGYRAGQRSKRKRK